ncbi:hypothetical protein [Pollutimonas bauzanensis]|uniref:hypothetical protein n=1 Tax=Pollutimonas bauzanensis TaxID=658167 RepID=UPI0015B6EAEA|nr:hypothetical protein [Pollutimonas bauzanensis]
MHFPTKVDMMLTAHKTAAIFLRYVLTEDASGRQVAEAMANRRKAISGTERSQETTA